MLGLDLAKSKAFDEASANLSVSKSLVKCCKSVLNPTERIVLHLSKYL